MHKLVCLYWHKDKGYLAGMWQGWSYGSILSSTTPCFGTSADTPPAAFAFSARHTFRTFRCLGWVGSPSCSQLKLMFRLDSSLLNKQTTNPPPASVTFRAHACSTMFHVRMAVAGADALKLVAWWTSLPGRPAESCAIATTSLFITMAKHSGWSAPMVVRSADSTFTGCDATDATACCKSTSCRNSAVMHVRDRERWHHTSHTAN